MQTIDPMDSRKAELAILTESEQTVEALRRTLTDIIDGPAFKGSHRCALLLKYIVDQSLAGRFELLKERLIGVEIFGRSPSYDTAVDAIVRVTASNVRKRLLLHHSGIGRSLEFRIRLPLGSYIPQISRVEKGTGELRPAQEINIAREPALREPVLSGSDPIVSSSNCAAALRGVNRDVPAKNFTVWRGRVLFVCVVCAAVFCGIVLGRHPLRVQASDSLSLPWSVLFKSPKTLHVITSDPNIAIMQDIIDSEIGVSNYANRQYVPGNNKLTPKQLRIALGILHDDNSASAVDPPVVGQIAALAAINAKVIDVRASRSIQFSDLKTDDNFIFLGSPRSDPWTALFSDQLDFRFVFDRTLDQEVVENVHPHTNEQLEYVPSALVRTSGQSYAIIGFLQNPDTNSRILLLAGTNWGGTEAAGKLVTDPGRLKDALNRCGLGAAGSFEILLGVNTIAGSTSHADVIACHVLGNPDSQ